MRIFTLFNAIFLSIAFSFAANAGILTPSAEEFVQKASMSNLFEIESSKLAQQRAQAADVKQFANRMIQDHTKAGNELKSAVRTANLSSSLIATALDEKHRDKLATLRGKTGEDFDEAYMEMQEDAHDDAVSLFEDYAEDGENAALKQFASKTLPTLKQHEELTDQMD